MQELTFGEVEQVSGGLVIIGPMGAFMRDLADALGMVGAVFDAGIGAVVDVACRITGDC